MSSSINQAFVEDFEARVHHLGQQEVSRARMAVRVRTGTGDIYNFERLAPEDMEEKTVRHSATPLLNIAHDRRRAGQRVWSWGEAVDNSDLAQILINPDSEYVQAAGFAYGRRIDRTIFNAVCSDTGTTDGAGSAVAYDTANQLIGAGTAKFSVDDLREAKKIIDEAEVMGDRYCAVSAIGLQHLLEVTEVASYDYNSVKALVQGEIDTFLGFKFIRTEQVPKATYAEDDNVIGVAAVCWAQPCIGLAISDDKFTRIGEDPSIRFSNRIYCETTHGAARIEDAGIVMIDHQPT